MSVCLFRKRKRFQDQGTSITWPEKTILQKDTLLFKLFATAEASMVEF